LGQKIFTHFKKVASLIGLPTDIKSQIYENSDAFIHRENLSLNSFGALLEQKHFCLLGRVLDVSKLLGQSMRHHLSCSVDAAITRYESSDLTCIIELDTLLKISRLTHNLLSKFITDMDPFDEIFSEVDEAVNLNEPNGRIVSHTIRIITCDVIPNYSFNGVTNRLLRSQVFYAP
jgi:cytoplasmic FMR1 interacting protein